VHEELYVTLLYVCSVYSEQFSHECYSLY